MRNGILKSVVAAAVGALCLQAVAYAAIPSGAGSSAQSGAAEAEEVATQVTDLDYDSAKEKFSGKVTSNLEIFDEDVTNECEAGRDVALHRKYTKKMKNGTKKKKDDVVGHDTTKANGTFAFTEEKKKGKYRVEVAEFGPWAFWAYYGAEGVLDDPVNMEVVCGPATGHF